MDTTIVINPGSASKKYALYRGGKELLSAHYEHTSDGYGKCVEIGGTRQRCEDADATQYADALRDVLAFAVRERVIESATEVKRAGVRIVAPGTFFTKHRLVDHVYRNRLQEVCDAAPLHIPQQLAELAVASEVLPHTRMVGVSDSAFHITMEQNAHIYGIAKSDAQALDLYRFGYHGLSVGSVVRQISTSQGRMQHRMIVCHIGSGVSVTALRDGKTVDTTMGFGPTSGLMMGTRAGDIDASALLYLLKRHDGNLEVVERMVTTEGGLRGLLGNGDLRVALDRVERGNQDAQVAITRFINEIKKAIGAMTTVLRGVDMLVLTATAAERNPTVRALVCGGLDHLGIVLDADANDALEGRAGTISASSGSVPVQVVHTNEMAEIAHITSVF